MPYLINSFHLHLIYRISLIVLKKILLFIPLPALVEGPYYYYVTVYSLTQILHYSHYS